MAQTPKRRHLPKDIMQRSDHDLMECVVGKRVMKEVDRIVSKTSQGTDSK
ncbi:MAG: hypothetical protein OXG06_04810 [Gammaproteobacteria bacterium]|nr:hypothetical protein [Gammaproteobacteria bacterium]